MQKRFIRIYKETDLIELKEHLLIYGDLSANCANCQEIDIKLDAISCPKCKTDFRYIAFRNIRNHLPKLSKILIDKPYIVFVDYDDFARLWGAHKAQEFLK
jgi:hypothetical protein